MVSLSLIDMAILCLCILTGLYARIFSVSVCSLIEDGKYRYLGRVLFHKRGDSYAVNIPARFIDQSVTTRFVITLPVFCGKGNRYSRLLVRYGEGRKCVLIQREAEFSI